MFGFNKCLNQVNVNNYISIHDLKRQLIERLHPIISNVKKQDDVIVY